MGRAGKCGWSGRCRRLLGKQCPENLLESVGCPGDGVQSDLFLLLGKHFKQSIHCLPGHVTIDVRGLRVHPKSEQAIADGPAKRACVGHCGEVSPLFPDSRAKECEPQRWSEILPADRVESLRAGHPGSGLPSMPPPPCPLTAGQVHLRARFLICSWNETVRTGKSGRRILVSNQESGAHQ